MGGEFAPGSLGPGVDREKGLRSETWNAEWIRYCTELQEEGYHINLPLDGEGTNVVGTLLPASQVKMQIPGQEPISSIYRSVWPLIWG